MTIDHIHFQFSTSTAWQSAVIRKLCHSPFSHIDLLLEDGNLLGASDHPDAPVIEGNPRGVAIRPPDYQEFGIRRVAILKTDRYDRVTELSRSQLGRPFDGGALYDFISDLFPGARDWRFPDSWFCAELFAWVLEESGFWRRSFIWPKNRVSPTDLLLALSLDDRFVNADTFWQPIEGVKLGPKER